MTDRSRKRIYVCEKEPQYRAMLEAALTLDEALVSGFSQYQDCLEKLATKPCDLLLVDLDGCEQEGLDLLKQARRRAPWISTLAIVGRAAISCAIRTIQAGAGDCLDKPVQQDRLVAAVGAQLARVETSTRHRPRALTQMEVRILQLILAGRTSYDMAAELHRSKRTIDVHRKNIMRKLQAVDLVDLIKRAIGMGFADPSEQAQGRQTQRPDKPEHTAE
jgi:DNA-binding NarL/FixJ family response regulator